MVAGPEWLKEPLGSKVQTSSLLKLEGKAELLVIHISDNMVIENGRRLFKLSTLFKNLWIRYISFYINH